LRVAASLLPKEEEHGHSQIIGVRLWTEEEWLASRDAQQGNSRLITNDFSDVVAIDEREEH